MPSISTDTDSLTPLPEVFPQPPPLIPRPDLAFTPKQKAASADVDKEPPTLTNMVTKTGAQDAIPDNSDFQRSMQLTVGEMERNSAGG